MMKKYLLCILAVFVFHTGIPQNADIQLLKHLNLNRNEHLDPAMKLLSNTTTEICILVPATLITGSFLKKDDSALRKSLIVGTSLATTAVITYVLKETVNRERPFVKYPFLDPGISVSSASFPSGHTSNSFSLATSLSLACPKWYVVVPSYLWASSVAYSRLHLGVHYPSDVLAGILIGSGSSFINYKINKLLYQKSQISKGVND